MIQPDAEESFTAFVAAVGREAAELFDPAKWVVGHQTARDFFHVQPAAFRAVNVADHVHWDAPGIETGVASAAAPRPRAKAGGQVIADATPMGPLTDCAVALRAEHVHL